MRSAALDFYHTVDNPDEYDAIIVSDMISVADLKGLWAGRTPPIVLYCHENQISYPARNQSEADLHFGFTSITSCLAADHVWFNSAFHQNAFLEALPAFLRRMPDRRPTWVGEAIAAKSRVAYPGIEVPRAATPGSEPRRRPVRSTARRAAPLVLWNHRWEFDKQPEVFFAAVDKLAERGVEFTLAVVGESNNTRPPVFEAARTCHADRIRSWGFVNDRAAYEALLCKADVVVSCAIQENFGISVLEAVAAGAVPVLPRRLTYPELFGPEEAVFYDTDEELADAIEAALTASDDPQAAVDTQVTGATAPAAFRAAASPGIRRRSTRRAQSFSWEKRIGAWDRGVESGVAG